MRECCAVFSPVQLARLTLPTGKPAIYLEISIN
jgi:hypothetical protein